MVLFQECAKKFILPLGYMKMKSRPVDKYAEADILVRCGSCKISPTGVVIIPGSACGAELSIFCGERRSSWWPKIESCGSLMFLYTRKFRPSS